jgi:dephospho-CoA kinase
VTVRIGLTGPIGCGKSTVAGWLREAGAVVVDADRVAREVLGPGTAESDAVAVRFGAALFGRDGTLDRAALGRIVFEDPAALRDLEAIVHPAVRPRILERIEAAERAAAPAVVVEAIKLVEGGLAELCDEVWLVTCPPAVQRERVVARGLGDTDADARIAAQRDLVEGVRSRASRVLDTSGAVVETRAATEAAFAAALDEAARS